MNCEIKSKICLSLKSLDNINLEELSERVENLEFRLDYINYNDVLSLDNLQKYKRIILKISEYKQIVDTINLIKHSENIYLDVDLELLEDSINIIEDGKNLIISKHNIDLYNYTEIISRIHKLSHINNISILKLVFNEKFNEKYNEKPNEYWNRKVLTKLYQDIQGISKVSIISFIEGDKSSFSRIYSLFLGAPFIYCGLDRNSLTGKGQLTLNEVYKYLNLLWSFEKHN
jgi:3-dehydroquinate dehydratase